MTPSQYELELVVKDKQGRERMITLTEWAYDAKDAFTQAIYNSSKHAKPGEEFTRLEYIGPPKELVAKAANLLARVDAAFDLAKAHKP